jgi:hypothetical protein
MVLEEREMTTQTCHNQRRRPDNIMAGALYAMAMILHVLGAPLRRIM